MSESSGFGARERPTIHQTLLNVATQWSHRSTCERAQVGAVVAQGGRVVSSGYNGAPAGMPHCEHLPGDTPTGCVVSVHAETNAVGYAARHGVSLAGSTLYTTLSPCPTCARVIAVAGIVAVHYQEMYRDVAGVYLLLSLGVEVYNGYGVRITPAQVNLEGGVRPLDGIRAELGWAAPVETGWTPTSFSYRPDFEDVPSKDDRGPFVYPHANPSTDTDGPR